MHIILRRIAVLAIGIGAFLPAFVFAGVQDDIDAKTKQIQALEAQVQAYQAQADAAGSQSKTLANEIARLNAQIGKLNTEISSLRLSIERTGLEIDQTRSAIDDATRKMQLHQQALSSALQERHIIDQQSLAMILIGHDTLSDFFDYVHDVQQAQDGLRTAIKSIRELRDNLDAQQSTLEDRKTELERLRILQETQQQQIASVKGSKNQLLQQTKGQEAKFQQLVQTTKKDIQKLRDQLTYLQQGGVTVEDAVKYAKLAALGAGIRPAFLLALLEVESRLGQNVGSGNWRDDMYLCYLRLADIAKTVTRKTYYRNRAENEKSAYFKIITALGLNPDTQKVSKEPSYGCGGAMGPAQFIPTTWMGYASAVIAQTGRSAANPWNTEDAFTAAAIKLSRSGAAAKTRSGELAAAKAYISGNPNCTQSICSYYANTILNKAATIEKEL